MEEDLIRMETALDVASSGLDYVETLMDLSDEAWEDEDIAASNNYLYAAKVLKSFIEEVLTNYENKI